MRKTPQQVLWRELTFAGQTFRVVQLFDEGGRDIRAMQVRVGRRYVPVDPKKLDRPT